MHVQFRGYKILMRLDKEKSLYDNVTCDQKFTFFSIEIGCVTTIYRCYVLQALK